MLCTICPFLGQNQYPLYPPPHPSSSSHWSWWISLLPFQPSGPWRSSAPPLLSHSHASLPPPPHAYCPHLPHFPLLCPLLPITSLLLSLGRCRVGMHPESLHFLHIRYNQDRKELRTFFSHDSEVAPGALWAGGLAGWLVGPLAGWMTCWPWKQRPEVHNLAGLAIGLSSLLAPKHLSVILTFGPL